MRKHLLALIFLVSFSSLGFGGIPSDEMNKAVLEALGSAVEKALDLPASSVGKIAGYFSVGDFKNAFFEIVNLATDTAISSIPIVGTVKFAAELEVALINLAKKYIDAKLVDAAWDVFESFTDREKQAWLNGDLDIEGIFANKLKNRLGMSYYWYIERNVKNLKELFKKYWDEQKRAKLYMEYVAKIASLIERAKYLIEPSLYYPSDGSTVKLTDKIQIWTSGNNYFKLDISLPDGKTATLKIKDPEDSNIVSFKFADFEGLDWNHYFSEYPDGVDVTLRVTAAVYDSTGLIEKLMGSDYVTPKEKIIRNIPGQDKVAVHVTFHFKVVSEEIKKSFNIVGTFSYHYYFEDFDMGGDESDSISLHMDLTCNPGTGSARAVDEDGDVWTGSCSLNGQNLSASLSLNLSGLLLHLNLDFSSRTAKLWSQGTYEDYGYYDGEFFYFQISNVRGTLSIQ